MLIYGASGSVGTYAVQLAKYFGAEVTAVCSAANHAMARSLGADHLIDYTAEDFTERNERYDLVFDAVWKLSKSKGKRALKPNGRFVSINDGYQESAEDLAFIKELIEADRLKAVIDRVYPLEQMVAALILTAFIAGGSDLRELAGRMFKWRVGLKWHLFAWLAPVVVLWLQR